MNIQFDLESGFSSVWCASVCLLLIGLIPTRKLGSIVTSCVPGHGPHAAIGKREQMWLARGRGEGLSMAKSLLCPQLSATECLAHTGHFPNVC